MVETTGWTYSPSEYTSYRSTEIVTYTSYIPCPVTTSYTTTYVCSECPCENCENTVTSTLCSVNLCSTEVDGQPTASSTSYSEGEEVTAVLIVTGVAVATTSILGSDCTAYLPLPNDNEVDIATLPACETVPPPNCPGCSTLCSPYLCQTDIDGELTFSADASFPPGATATAEVISDGNLVSKEDLDPGDCTAFLGIPQETDVNVGALPTCEGGGEPDNNNSNCETTVVYTWTSNGETYAGETVLNSNCNSFQYPGRGLGNRRFNGGNAYLFFWVWAICAVVAGTGMIIL